MCAQMDTHTQTLGQHVFSSWVSVRHAGEHGLEESLRDSAGKAGVSREFKFCDTKLSQGSIKNSTSKTSCSEMIFWWVIFRYQKYALEPLSSIAQVLVG